jgi:fumarate hydratase class II
MDAVANRQHRKTKTINENLGLIIALAASGAAVGTGYEAHHARLEARTAAEQSLKVQHDSV